MGFLISLYVFAPNVYVPGILKFATKKDIPMGSDMIINIVSHFEFFRIF